MDVTLGTSELLVAPVPTTATDTRRIRHNGRAARFLVFLGLATFGLYSIRVAGWTISDGFFVAAATLLVLDHLAGRTSGYAAPSARRTPPALQVCILVMLTSGTLTSFWSLDAFGSMGVVLRLAWLTLVWFWILRTTTTNVRDLDYFVLGLKVTMMISAVAVLAGHVGLVSFTMPDGQPVGNRQPGFSDHPNQVGALLAVGLLIFILDVRASPGDPPRYGKLGRFAAVAVIAVAITATGSMTAAAAAAAGAVTIGVVLLATAQASRRHRSPLSGIVLLAVTGAGLWLLVTSASPLVERFTAWIEGDDATTESVGSRREYIDVVVDQIDERLVLGVGLDTESAHFDPRTNVAGAGHSVYFKVLYQAGLPAMAALIALTVITWTMLWRLAVASRRGPLFPLAATLLGAIVATNVVSQTSPGLYDRTLWLPLGLGGALAVVHHQGDLRRSDDGPRREPAHG